MKKLLLKILPLILIVSFTISACKKKSDVPSKSKTTLLTQKSWSITKWEEKTDSDPFIDAYPTWDACSKDDFILFKTNNTADFDEGPTKCDPSDPQTESSSWAFLENETKLLAQGFTFFIERLDDDNLIISASQTSGGSTYTLKITFKH
jgi:hypothetical protein